MGVNFSHIFSFLKILIIIVSLPSFHFCQTKKVNCLQSQTIAREFLFCLQKKHLTGICNLAVTLEERLNLVYKDSVHSSKKWTESCIKLSKWRGEKRNEQIKKQYQKLFDWAKFSNIVIEDSKLIKVVEECGGCSECGIDLADLVLKLKYKNTEFEIKLYNCPQVGDCRKISEFFDICYFSIPIKY